MQQPTAAHGRLLLQSPMGQVLLIVWSGHSTSSVDCKGERGVHRHIRPCVVLGRGTPIGRPRAERPRALS